VPLIILSSFTALRSLQLPTKQAYWFRLHPAVSFIVGICGIRPFRSLPIWIRRTSGPSLSLSARQSVSQDNVVQARGGVICHAAFAGLPLMSFFLFSTFNSEQVFPWFLRLTVASSYRWLAHIRHIQGLFSDPPCAFALLEPTFSPFGKNERS
jgi:hypothetical protein